MAATNSRKRKLEEGAPARFNIPLCQVDALVKEMTGPRKGKQAVDDMSLMDIYTLRAIGNPEEKEGYEDVEIEYFMPMRTTIKIIGDAPDVTVNTLRVVITCTRDGKPCRAVLHAVLHVERLVLNIKSIHEQELFLNDLDLFVDQ